MFITGQCYDGAAAMKGKRNGLKTLILEDNKKASYIHCYAHSLQLSIQDATKCSRVFSDAIDVCSEVANLIRSSPKRLASLKTIKQQIQEPSINIRSLCPTR